MAAASKKPASSSRRTVEMPNLYGKAAKKMGAEGPKKSKPVKKK